MVLFTQKLFTTPEHPKGQKVLVTAALSNFPLEVPAFAWSDLKSREFAAISPFRSVPLLQLEDVSLSNTDAMLIHIATLASSPLYCGPPESLALIDSLLEFISAEIEPCCTLIRSYMLGQGESRESFERAVDYLKKKLKEIEKTMKKQEFLCGKLSLADISLACELLFPMRTIFDEQTRNGLRTISAWFGLFMTIPAFAEVTGPVVLCTQVETPLEPAGRQKKQQKPKAPKEEDKKEPSDN